MTRRHFLSHVAGYSALALPGLEFIRTIQANAQELRRNNKSLIIMWMAGGPATIDIWDLKPGRPTGGEFREMNTNVQGIRISEHMPQTASQMSHLNIIRSLTTSEGDHGRGTQLMHTSYTPNPALQFPSIGSVAAHEVPKLQGYRDISLPNYVTVGNAAMPTGGFLGMNYAPFTVQNAGTPPENIRPSRSLGGTEQEAEDRIRRRQRLFYMVEDDFMRSRAPHLTEKERPRFADASKAHEDVYYKGFSLVASKEGKVFDLKGEPTKLMESYGAAGNMGMAGVGFGRSAILARRLVESGVSAVEISLGGWDTHNATFNAHSTRLQPAIDKAIGGLVSDLVDRGMWQNTVLLWMGEFGRTPRINQNVGRDHWSRNWSILVGGGAMPGGRVHGSSDQDGMSVAQNPVHVGDVFATIYRALGIDPTTQVRDPIGRPFAIAGTHLGRPGRPIEGLF